MVTSGLCVCFFPSISLKIVSQQTQVCYIESVTLMSQSIYTSISNYFLLNVGRLNAFIISGSGEAAFITLDTAAAPAGSDLTGINGSDHQLRHPH